MRRTMKKSISLLLALCMLAGLCLPAAAETAGVPGAGRVEDNSPAVIYTDAGGAVVTPDGTSKGDGTWYTREGRITQFNMPKAMEENEQAPSVSLTFQGDGIIIYGELAENGPCMSAVIDGKAEGHADFFGSDECGVAYEKRGLGNGPHTITLTYTREMLTATPEDSANWEQLQAAIDYFEVTAPQESHIVTVVGGTADVETAEPGDTVTITAGQPEEGDMSFQDWTSPDGVVFDDAAMEMTTFTMPDTDVTLTANFALAATEIGAMAREADMKAGVEYWTTNSYVNPF